MFIFYIGGREWGREDGQLEEGRVILDFLGLGFVIFSELFFFFIDIFEDLY